MDFVLLQKLGVALALATLVGLEREHRYQLEKVTGFGGIRTFSLIGLLGALAYILNESVPYIFLILTSGFLVLVISSYIVTSKLHKTSGATSEIASILVYIIGVLSALGLYLLATLVALVVLIMLYFKDSLHNWAKGLKSRELVSTIQFMIIVFVVLPLLPDKNFGPYGFFNPYLTWLMVVLISGISFVSYIAIKLFGQKKGLTVTGFLAGFISSTALTLNFAGQSKKNKVVVNPFALAIVIAGSAMFFRILLEISILNHELLDLLFIPLIVMGGAGMLGALFLWLKREKMPKNIEEKMLEVTSPFSLYPAIKFAAIFSVILFFSKLALDLMGDRGIYLTSFISGLFDVDAIVVSMANLAKNGLDKSSAALAIIIAAMTNTFSKILIFFLLGSWKVAMKIFYVFLFVVFSGIFTVVFTNLI